MNKVKMNMKNKSGEPLGELLLHFLHNFDPDLLFSKRKHKDHKERLAFDMFTRLNDVRTVLDRLQKYPVYFESFYIDDKNLISDAEAIEYHLHSFIQDIYILQERLLRIIGHIKRELITFDLDHDIYFKELIEHLGIQVKSTLGAVTDGSRKRHVHDTTVRDSNISEARLFDTLRMVDPPKDHLLSEKSFKLTTKAKNHYIKEAKRNAEHVSKLEDFIAPRFGVVLTHFFEQDGSKFKARIQAK